MPTGYTSNLHDGEQTFEEFVLGCARAFGALILMRDDPADAEIPDEITPSTWAADSLAEARQKLAELNAMTAEQVEAAATAEYDEAVRYWEEQVAKTAAIRSRYEAMLAEVDAWQPPSADHVNLKEFMRSQLRESIRFDRYEPKAPERATPQEWQDRERQRLIDSIGRYAEQDAKERARAESRTEWVRALRRSLGAEVSA